MVFVKQVADFNSRKGMCRTKRRMPSQWICVLCIYNVIVQTAWLLMHCICMHLWGIGMKALNEISLLTTICARWVTLQFFSEMWKYKWNIISFRFNWLLISLSHEYINRLVCEWAIKYPPLCSPHGPKTEPRDTPPLEFTQNIYNIIDKLLFSLADCKCPNEMNL